MQVTIYDPNYYNTEEYENSEVVIHTLFEYSPFFNYDGSVKDDIEIWRYELDQYITAWAKSKGFDTPWPELKEEGPSELVAELEEEEKRVKPIFKERYKDAENPKPLSGEDLKKLTDQLKKQYLDEFRLLDSRHDILGAGIILQRSLTALHVKLPRFCMIKYTAKTWIAEADVYDVFIFEKEVRHIWELIVKVRNKYIHNLSLEESKFGDNIKIYYDTIDQCLCLSRRTPGTGGEEYELVKIYFFDPLDVKEHLSLLDEFRKYYKIQTPSDERLWLAKYIKTGLCCPEAFNIDPTELVGKLYLNCLPLGDLVDYIWDPDDNKHICDKFIEQDDPENSMDKKIESSIEEASTCGYDASEKDNQDRYDEDDPDNGMDKKIDSIIEAASSYANASEKDNQDRYDEAIRRLTTGCMMDKRSVDDVKVILNRLIYAIWGVKPLRRYVDLDGTITDTISCKHWKHKYAEGAVRQRAETFGEEVLKDLLRFIDQEDRISFDEDAWYVNVIC